MVVCMNYNSVDLCDGDSGAPLWIIKKKENSEQNILVAVFEGGYESQMYFQPSCPNTASKAHKMTDKVLAWIRKNMVR